MKNSVEIIRIPKLNVSDDVYQITKIMYEDGDEVKEGDIIGSIESSKNASDIESPCNGFIFYKANEDDEIPVNEVFAVISINKTLPKEFITHDKTTFENNNTENIEDADISDLRISKPAQRLIDKHQIDISVFEGKKIIEKKDVEEYVSNKNEKKKIVANQNGAKDLPERNKIVLIGFGGLTKVCIDILHQMNTYEIVGIVDSYNEKGLQVQSYKILGGEEILEDLIKQGVRNAVISFGAVGIQKNRELTYQKLKKLGFSLPNIIHPKAIIEPSAIIGEANLIFAGATIGSDVTIANNCLINVNSTICHSSYLSNNVHIAPGATIAGRVNIGTNTLIGMGVTVYFDLNIGANVIVNNGVDIFENISDNDIIKP